MRYEWKIRESFPLENEGKGYEIKIDIEDSFWIVVNNENPEEIVKKIIKEIEAIIEKYRI